METQHREYDRTSPRAMIAMLLFAAMASHTGARADEVLPSRLTTVDPSHAPSCLRDTGTRIPRKAPECSATGDSYTGEDIKGTGAISVGDALRLLDPSITIHR
jgi:hypothetical protein